MPVITAHPPGAPCWFELSTSDQNAAKKFYAEVFGWSIDDHDMGPEGVYTIFQVAGSDVAAACTLQDPAMRPAWMIFFHAPDVDASAAKAKQLGGTVVAGPFDAGEYGRMAVLRDPEGVHFALWQPKAHIGSQRINETNCIGWSELLSADVRKAERFYSELLGLYTKSHTGGDTPYIEFGAGGTHMGGFLQKERGMEAIPPHWSFYIVVDDCDRVTQRTQELGGRLLYGPFDPPGLGRVAILLDAQGAKFNVIQLSAAA